VGAWQESGQQWRRLQATFPAQIDTHCQQQTFYVDTDGLIRRHDFVAERRGGRRHDRPAEGRVCDAHAHHL
jgi:hypothetical protein